MKNFRFVLEIPANCEQEAKAKLNLMLQWAAFPKDRNISSLAGSCLLYLAWNSLGKSWTASRTAKPGSPKYRLTTRKPA